MTNKRRHVNIPVFIPHLGCPNDCVFCNQHRISGRTAFSPALAEAEIEQALKTVDPRDTDVEIAFFGGSFTGIDRAEMIALLEIAHRYVRRGAVKAIRISTRPDYIDEEILSLLARYGVTDIELGLQSLCDPVLIACRRGHTAAQAEEACVLIKAHGFSLVGQMMIGLPRSSPEDEIRTAEKICELGCGGVRIYPTVVFRDTALADQTAAGEYVPLTCKEAVERAASVLEIFVSAHIPALRIGLCASESVLEEGAILGGGYHSAMGELVYGELYYRRIRAQMEGMGGADALSGRRLTLEVPVGQVSKAIGQHGINRRRLQNEYNVKNVKVIENPSLFWYNIKMDYQV